MWTTEPPSEAGHYWHKVNYDSVFQVREIIYTMNGLRVRIGGAKYKLDNFGGFWHPERIKEPQE